MTLMPRRLIAQQGSDAKIPAEDLRLGLTALFSPGSAANAARTGILRGSGAPGFTACQVLSSVASQLTVKQGAFIVQQVTVNGGAYIGVIDSDQTLTLTPPAAGNYKAGYVIAHCYDEAYGDSQDGFALEVLLGAAATTAASAAYPAVPNNAVVLRGFTVDATGAITLSTQPTYTGTHNGILPVLAGDTGAGVYDGQWRDEPTAGLQRWSSSAAAWSRPHARFLGTGTSFPSAAQPGDTFTRSDVGAGTAFLLTTNGWRALEQIVVADRPGRDALGALGVLNPGDRVITSAGDLWVWTPTGWSYPNRNVVTAVGTGTWNVTSYGGSVTSTFVVPFSGLTPVNAALFTFSAGALTCVQPGTYLVGGTVAVLTNSKATTGTLRVAAVFVNGVQSKLAASGNQLPANTHSYSVLCPPAPLTLAVGDVLDFRFLQDSGDTQPVVLDDTYLFAQFLTA